MTEMLQNDLTSLIIWADRWQMKFNPSKCKAVIVTKTPTNTPLVYTISNATLFTVTNFTYLGIIIDSSLSFSGHINYIAAGANQTLHMLMITWKTHKS